MSVDKLIKNDMVAVIVSHGFGSGFSTSMREKRNRESALFDPTLVSLIEQDDMAALLAAAELIYGGCMGESIGEVDSLAVVWVPEGTRFMIRDYDGAEYLILEGDLNFTA